MPMIERVVSGGERRQVSTERLAELLVAYEGSFIGERPERVVLADDSDEALAAALVATKLLIPLVARPAAIQGATANGRLIAQLADA
jgi:hypothetical protein